MSHFEFYIMVKIVLIIYILIKKNFNALYYFKIKYKYLNKYQILKLLSI